MTGAELGSLTLNSGITVKALMARQCVQPAKNSGNDRQAVMLQIRMCCKSHARPNAWRGPFATSALWMFSGKAFSHALRVVVQAPASGVAGSGGWTCQAPRPWKAKGRMRSRRSGSATALRPPPAAPAP